MEHLDMDCKFGGYQESIHMDMDYIMDINKLGDTISMIEHENLDLDFLDFASIHINQIL